MPIRRHKGRSPRGRRWSDTGFNYSLLDWVRDQRETLDWAREERRLAAVSESESQSVHGENIEQSQQRRRRLVAGAGVEDEVEEEERRMTQSASDLGLHHREHLDDIRRNPFEEMPTTITTSPERPVSVVNVDNEPPGIGSTRSVDNSELQSISEGDTAVVVVVANATMANESEEEEDSSVKGKKNKNELVVDVNIDDSGSDLECLDEDQHHQIPATTTSISTTTTTTSASNGNAATRATIVNNTTTTISSRGSNNMKNDEDEAEEDEEDQCSICTTESTGGGSRSSIARARQIVERRAADRMQKTTNSNIMLHQSQKSVAEKARGAIQARMMQTKQSLVKQLVKDRASHNSNSNSSNSTSAAAAADAASFEEQQPDLIPSTTTEDTDDRSSVVGNGNSSICTTSREQQQTAKLTIRDALLANQYSNATTTTSNKQEEQNRREAINYLLQYETMVLQQEAEEIATVTYIRPLLERLNVLGGGQRRRQQNKEEGVLECTNFTTTTTTSTSTTAKTNNEDLYNDLCQRSITYSQLKRALNILERCDSSSSTTTTTNNNMMRISTELLTRDKQLILILRMLTQKHSSANEQDCTQAEDDVLISWAEIIHCYRVCILGMSTLKHMPKNEGDDSSNEVRSRSKDRILSQLSLFELPATKLLNEEKRIDGSSAAALLDVDVNHNNERGSNSSSKSTTRSKSSIPTIAAICFAAAAVGFVTGSNYKSAGSALSNITLAPPETELYNRTQENIGQHYHIEFCPAKAPAVRPEDVVPRNLTEVSSVHFQLPKMRVTLPQGFPQQEQEQENPNLDVNTMPVADLNQGGEPVKEEIASVPVRHRRERVTSGEKAQKPIWQHLTPKQQAAASALVGAAAAMVAPPQVMALYKAVSSTLSLSGLGLVPAALVVIGAFAVGVNFVKGVHHLVRRLMNLRGL